MRAKLVLMDDTLRKEYDLLGLDLEEDQKREDQGDTSTSHMLIATIATILRFAGNTVEIFVYVRSVWSGGYGNGNVSGISYCRFLPLVFKRF